MVDVDPCLGSQTIVFGGALGLRWRRVQAALAEWPGTVAVRCDGKAAEVLARCQKLVPCVLVVNHAFLNTINPEDFKAAVDFGHSIQVLVENEKDDFNTIEKLVRMGCLGVIKSTAPVRAILLALRAVGAGEFWIDGKAMSRLLRALLVQEERKLTERESQILHLIGEGLKNQEIARRLFISPQTVRWHLRSLYSKLGIHDRPAAVLNGLEVRKSAIRARLRAGGPPKPDGFRAALPMAG